MKLKTNEYFSFVVGNAWKSLDRYIGRTFSKFDLRIYIYFKSLVSLELIAMSELSYFDQTIERIVRKY